MDEEDARPGARAAKPGPPDASRGVPDLSLPVRLTQTVVISVPIFATFSVAKVGNHEFGCPRSGFSDLGRKLRTVKDLIHEVKNPTRGK